jgi:peptidoglycan/LPS O-acetylase OafA/YrhL
MDARKIGLDYVRAVAILLVLICHSLTIYVSPHSHIAVPFGVAGVEIFFVLSGYLIGGIFLSSVEKNSGVISVHLVGNFWTRRWLRTVPNYLLFLLIFAIIQREVLSPRILLYLTFSQNLGWSMKGSLFEVSWSLAVEEWFYLLMPLLALIIYQLTRRHRSAMIATTTILFAAPLILRLTLGHDKRWDDDIRKVVMYRLDAIMWGVILAAIQRYRSSLFKTLQRPTVFFAGFFVLIIAAAWTYYMSRLDGDFTNTRGTAFIFTSFNLACALMIPYCASIATVPSITNRLAYFISVWSYSMYLCHVIVFKGIDRAFGVFHFPTGAGYRAAIAWPIIFALSAAIYYSFELPILRLRDRWTHHRSIATVVPDAVISV